MATMDMRVQAKDFLVPGMENAEEANLRAQMFGIAGDFQRGFRRAGRETKDRRSTFLFRAVTWRVLTPAGSVKTRMDVACGQKLLLRRCRDPAFPSGSLTLRAMPVSAGVVRDRGPMPTATCIDPDARPVRRCDRTMASSTLTCFQPIHWRLRWMKPAPAARDEIGHL